MEERTRATATSTAISTASSTSNLRASRYDLQLHLRLHLHLQLTYHVYDDKDRLTKVVPPGSTNTSTTLNYEYTYDAKDNLLTKKVPDQGLINLKYNNRRLLTYIQDANLLAAGQWLNTQYDSYGRLTKTGIYMTPYNGMGNNPILYNDPLGDTIRLNSIGYIISNDLTDNLVYYTDNSNSLFFIGELGKKIDINIIYSNLLEQNMEAADGMWNPVTFRNLVKNHGEWDLKNNENTIYGLGNDGATQFEFNGEIMESQDIGNHHFGAVAQDFGFTEEFSLRQAGKAQMASGTSRREWQKYEYRILSPDGTGIQTMLPPYGDDPRDQKWISSGFNYARKH